MTARWWDEPLRQFDHRRWPPPAGAWAVRMRWHDLLFAHWPVPAEILRPLVPAALTLDTYAGQAWVGVVPFRMSGIAPRAWLGAGWAFPEINVRTYVTTGDRAGVWFFSLDAADSLVVAVARRRFHLPYFRARMQVQDDGEWTVYRSRRTDGRIASGEFQGRYRPTGPVALAAPGTLEHWLTERYCLYAADRRGWVYRGDVHHAPWPLQPAVADLAVNTVATAHGLNFTGPPVLHFARQLDVVAWAPVRLA